MRLMFFTAIALLAFVACEPPPEGSGAASPSKDEGSSSSSSSSPPAKPLSEEEAARASRPRPAPRPSAIAIADLEKQERLLDATAKTAPDRPKLLRRLAEGYIDLAADAKDQGRGEKVVQGARRRAIKHYQEIVKEHPSSASMDEILYELARAYEAAGDLRNARATYYDLIKRFPSSPLIGRAYYAFGVMFREEAKTDPSKWALAQQGFGEARKMSPLSDPIHGLAMAEEAVAETNKPSDASLAAAQARATAAKPAEVTPPAPAPTPTPARIGTDGTYVAEGGNYRIQVKFEAGKIIVTEPNRTSSYEQQGDSRVFKWRDDSLNMVFFLEVAPDGKSLLAYNEKNGAQKGTRLTLITPMAPTAATECKGTPLPVEVQNETAVNPNKERLFGRNDDEEIRPFVGEYKTEGGRPIIELKKGGAGVFEMHGVERNAEYSYPITWWLQANCDGTLVSTKHPGGAAQYWLVVKFARPYQGHTFERKGLTVRPDGTMYILDRKKSP